MSMDAMRNSPATAALCLDVAKAAVQLPAQPGGQPLATVLGDHLAEVLIREMAGKLANTLPAALIDTIAADMLFGADQVAAFSGLTARQVYHMAQIGVIPVFRMGQTICGRKSTWLAWIEAQEQAGRKAGA